MNNVDLNRDDMLLALDKAEARAKLAEDKLAKTQWLVLVAQDIVECWPKMTFRTLSTMCERINNLSKALVDLK